VEAPDNEKYLDLTFDGKISSMGTVFLNCWNDRLLMDRNTIIYGHNIKGGIMFNPVMDYKHAATYQKAPVIVLEGLTGRTAWVVFASMVIEEDWWGYASPNPNTADFTEMLEDIKERSLFHTDVEVDANDRLLMLSTCDYTNEDVRFIVYARKIRPGEDEPESVTAVKNPSQKPHVVPMQTRLSALTANRTGILQIPGGTKMYYYQARAGGIDWYSGSTTVVQGMFDYVAGNIAADAIVSAAFDPDRDKRILYVVTDKFGGQKGIYLFTSNISSRYRVSSGWVSPPGVDARSPAMQYENGRIWLLYTEPRSNREIIYRRRLDNRQAVGEPEPLQTVPGGSGNRALAFYEIGGAMLLLWHDTTAKTVYGAWDGGEPFALALPGDCDRINIYGALSSGKVKAAVEKNGSFTFTEIDINSLPKKEDMIPPSPEPEPEPDPDGDSGPDGGTESCPDGPDGDALTEGLDELEENN
jgi:sortase B